MRLIYQQFRNVTGRHVTRKGTFEHSIDSNFGITGLLMPAVLIGAIFNQLHWLVIFYAVFHVAAFSLVSVRLVIKAEGLREKEQNP